MVTGDLTYQNIPNQQKVPNIPELHIQRIERISNYCSDPKRKENERVYKNTYMFKTLRNNYFYEKFNIAYCKVPKVGCTFMVEMFQILERGRKPKLVSRSRSAIHSLTNRHRQTPIEGMSTLSTVRDPYSRLYSAYVDKILLPNIYSTSIKIRKINTEEGKLKYANKTLCANDISFQQFLDFLVTTAQSTVFMNKHWAPINEICHFCETNNYMIIQQETFGDDVMDFMTSLNVPADNFQAVKQLMTKQRIAATIPGIVEVVLKRQHTTKEIKACLSRTDVLKKLWLSFQIQGYISEQEPFPDVAFSKIAGKTSSVPFSDIMVHAANQSSLTKDESRRQRKKYLTSAYREISAGTLEGIKQIYRADFELFNYDTSPPVRLD